MGCVEVHHFMSIAPPKPGWALAFGPAPVHRRQYPGDGRVDTRRIILYL